MAEPGDPPLPDDDVPPLWDEAEPDDGPRPVEIDAHQAHDDLVGFASAAGLVGRDRAPDPDPELKPRAKRTPKPVADPVSIADGDALPAWAIESEPSPAHPTPTFGRAAPPPAVADGAMGLYAVYALILFAVPTLGVSALIALLAVTGRPAPEQPLARSHFIFQQRTLWASAVAALAGAILIVVNLGVFVLFVAAVWVVVRGAWGVLTLKSGVTIANPHTWLIEGKPA